MDVFQSLLQLCGVGLLLCCGLIVAGVLFMVFTGRLLLIPPLFSSIPKIISGAFDMVFGGLTDTDNSRDSSRRYDDADGEGRPSKRGMSAAERIRAKRENFSAEAPPLRPSPTASKELRPRDPRSAGKTRTPPASPDFTPERKTWEQGGPRGPIEDRYDIRGPDQPKPDMRGIGVRRNRWKRDITDDAALGGIYDEDGDGFPET